MLPLTTESSFQNLVWVYSKAWVIPRIKVLDFFKLRSKYLCQKSRNLLILAAFDCRSENATSSFLRTRTMFQLLLQFDILKDNRQYKFISISGQVLKYFSLYVQFLRIAESFPDIALKYYGSVFSQINLVCLSLYKCIVFLGEFWGAFETFSVY